MKDRTMKRNTWVLALVFSAALIVGASAVQASPIVFDLVGISFPDFIGAEVTLDYNGTNKLFVDIKNTSTAKESYLTAFAFNVSANITGVSSFTGPEGWKKSYDRNDIDTPGNLGFFDVAGLTGNNFSGGDTHDGIAQGETFHFVFKFSGSNLSSLTTEDFISLFSWPQNSQSDVERFAARFQGIKFGGERCGDGESDVAVVPIPGAVWLLGSGLVGVLALRRKS